MKSIIAGYPLKARYLILSFRANARNLEVFKISLFARNDKVSRLKLEVINALVFVLITASVSAAELSPPTQIEVFTDRDYPVAAQGHGNVDVYRLDIPARIEQALSAGLPADPVTAKQIVIQRVRQAASTQAGHLKHAYEGLLKARQYRLDLLPAFVFDGGLAVVYGVTDIEVALLHYRQWRQSQGDPRS